MRGEQFPLFAQKNYLSCFKPRPTTRKSTTDDTQLGKYNFTVNAILPGLIDTSLTRYYAHYRNNMAETGQKPPERPRPRQAWDVRTPTVTLKVGSFQPMTFLLSRSSSPLMRRRQ